MTINPYENLLIAVIYNATETYQVTVSNPYWDWAAHQLESNNYNFSFFYPSVFPFSPTYFDPHDQYCFLSTSPLLNITTHYYLVTYMTLLLTIGRTISFLHTTWQNKNRHYIRLTCSYLVPVSQCNKTKYGHRNCQIGNELIIDNLHTGIEFSYDSLNVPIALHVVYNVGGSIYYVFTTLMLLRYTISKLLCQSK